ncbi:MAG: 4Fe-4S double cluster binding domain-containing protein [Desulfobacterales bacterium]|nr:4Fe-4S double cluster binding domain-containing protein [Desulfobacterales bacterium]
MVVFWSVRRPCRTIHDFCAKCKKCARKCPSGAISSGDKIFRNGYETWPMDVKKCTLYRRGNKKGAGCGVCINVCPWNKPYTPFHRSVAWTMRNIPSLRNFAVWADDIMGYGRPKPEKQWWLDL